MVLRLSGDSFWICPLFVCVIVYSGCKVDSEESKPSFKEQLILANDTIVERYLGQQNLDSSSENYGGFVDAQGIHHIGSAAGITQRMTAAYVEEVSRFYQSENLREAMLRALDFLIRKQHSDGTIDLLSTNFHSTPDLAFAVEPLALSYKVLLDQAELPEARDKIEIFLRKGGEALSLGGIHTPNHRWVVCMALARLNQLFPNPVYLDRIETWLREKIDIDPDGQYTERSTGVYSPLTDRCLITVADLTGKPELLDPVRANLDMTLYYVHANGEIATEASRRQDQYMARNLSPYHYPYVFMARWDQNPVYAAMSSFIREMAPMSSLSSQILLFLEDPALLDSMSQSQIPTNFERHFPYSNLARVRRGSRDASILAKNQAFFTYHKGVAVLEAMRLASAFFGKGQFVADTLIIEEGTYRLTQSWEGPYYQPYPVDSLPSDGDWHKMPRKNRPQSEVQKLEAEIVIKELDQGFEVDIQLAGTDHVPVALELAFRKGGILSGVRKLETAEDSFVLHDDEMYYVQGPDTIHVQGFPPDHEWTQLRGAAPKIDAESVYLTGYTPFSRTIMIY